VSAAEKDGRRLVCVTMKCATKQDFPDTVALFEYGFNNFSVQEVNRTVDGYKETGRVTLPVNATIDNTWSKDDGSGKLTYYYEEQVVGYGERTKESIFSGKDDKKDNGTTDTVEGQDVSAQGEASDSPVTEETKRSGSGLLIIISILLVLLIIIFAIHMRIQREKRRLRKRKRRRNKKEE
jgi:D-alanyl-D-alanine carboxypeptidase